MARKSQKKTYKMKQNGKGEARSHGPGKESKALPCLDNEKPLRSLKQNSDLDSLPFLKDPYGCGTENRLEACKS